MPIFCNLPTSLNDNFDFYTELRVQFALAVQYRQKIYDLLSKMKSIGEIRFYIKKTKYHRKRDNKDLKYEYNCQHLRYSHSVMDDSGHKKIYHSTRYLKKNEYELIMREAYFYEYIKLQYNIVCDIANKTKNFLLRGFYHHPDDIPDFDDECSKICSQIYDVQHHQEWHFYNRISRDPSKYGCIDENNMRFMSRGELLLNNAFRSCGLMPKYEVLYHDAKTGKNYYPDFSCKIDDKTIYFEYFGMMRDSAYFHECCEKLKSYLQHGIIPGYNFIAFFSGESSAIHMKPVFDTLKALCGKKSLLENYSANNEILPGLIALDNSSYIYQISDLIFNTFQEKILPLLPKKHRLKSSEKTN